MPRVLLVEDDESLLEEIERVIQHDGSDVTSVMTIADAREHLKAATFDLIILDWGLPDGDGISLCTALRDQGHTASILMLTGRSSVSEKEQGFTAGADDYLTKPFHLKELTLRVRKLLARSKRPLQGDLLRVDNLVLDRSKLHVTMGGAVVDLTAKELALLEFLMRNKNQVYSLDDLLSHIWVAEEEAAPDTVRTHIKNLRRKLEAHGRDFIETVHGVGYKFVG
jgi:DNA-binding response OmpR family regulator